MCIQCEDPDCLQRNKPSRVEFALAIITLVTVIVSAIVTFILTSIC